MHPVPTLPRQSAKYLGVFGTIKKYQSAPSIAMEHLDPLARYWY